MTREEIWAELKARNKRKQTLHRELLEAELFLQDTDPVRTAISNNYARIDMLLDMLSLIDSNEQTSLPPAGAA